jgi:hypothetical protein
MALIRLMCALALGGTFAAVAVAPWTKALAGPDVQQHTWVGPIPPKDTIYRPECMLDDDSSRYCSGDRSK